jgi:hypothetical protein
MSNSSASFPPPDDYRRFRTELRDSLARTRLALCHVETLMIALALFKSVPTPHAAKALPRVPPPPSEPLRE